MLFLGVLLGVSGNLFANILDRYFAHYGFGYELVVVLLFCGLVIYFDRLFIKILDKK